MGDLVSLLRSGGVVEDFRCVLDEPLDGQSLAGHIGKLFG